MSVVKSANGSRALNIATAVTETIIAKDVFETCSGGRLVAIDNISTTTTTKSELLA